ncbi:MAG: exodeoxyribonuclease VII small subunit [Defluviitaleaceae bacterium]|nr:exodeoxyribonuclease VII small subunit [Defluviitaleaceae bacterium]
MKSFEEKLERLSQIVEQVEDSETPLDTAIELYKSGISIAKECGEVLRGYEAEVLTLRKQADEFVLTPIS